MGGEVLPRSAPGCSGSDCCTLLQNGKDGWHNMAHRMDSDSMLSAHSLSKCLAYIPYYYSRCGRVASWALHEVELGIRNVEC